MNTEPHDHIGGIDPPLLHTPRGSPDEAFDEL